MSIAAPPAAIPFWRSTAFIIVCGCVISTIAFGLRSTYGLFTEPLSLANGWGREVFAFAIAVQNLLWGIGQPIAGAIADRYGTARVLVFGGILYALGIVATAFSTTPMGITFGAGFLVGIGLSGSAFGVVLAAFSKLVPDDRRSWALGIGTAAGSFGQFLFAPLGQTFISAYGWQAALVLLAGFALLIPFLAIPLRTRGPSAVRADEVEMSMGSAMGKAFGYSSFTMLVAGFFVCGWQIGFITVHLPAYLSGLGMGPSIAAWAIAVIGLFNVIGAYSSGILGGRFPKRYLLSGIYLVRAIIIALFITLPMSTALVFAFAAIMGLLWLSTVPLTTGLVAGMFGTRYMGTLFGIVFLSHQVGSFLGVWLGGLFFDLYGSYDLIWWGSIGLGLFAAFIHLPISEQRAPQFVVASG